MARVKGRVVTKRIDKSSPLRREEHGDGRGVDATVTCRSWCSREETTEVTTSSDAGNHGYFKMAVNRGKVRCWVKPKGFLPERFEFVAERDDRPKRVVFRMRRPTVSIKVVNRNRHSDEVIGHGIRVRCEACKEGDGAAKREAVDADTDDDGIADFSMVDAPPDQQVRCWVDDEHFGSGETPCVPLGTERRLPVRAENRRVGKITVMERNGEEPSPAADVEVRCVRCLRERDGEVVALGVVEENPGFVAFSDENGVAIVNIEDASSVHCKANDERFGLGSTGDVCVEAGETDRILLQKPTDHIVR
jgi:hypothetical protein